VPTVTPETLPEASTVATDVLLLPHVPADVTSARVVIAPRHDTADPVMAAGIGFTVTFVDITQPPGAV